MYQTRSASSLRQFRPPAFARWALVPLLLLAAALLALGWLVLVKTQGRDALAATADLRAGRAAAATATLTRSGAAGDGEEVEVILTTPAFFRLTDRTAEAAALGADRALVMVANENVHFGDLPHHFAPILRLDDTRLVMPTEVRVLTDAVHHRTSVVVFGDLPADLVEESHTLELLLPPTASGARSALTWYTPVDYPSAVAQAQGISLGLLLSLAAGLLAAISPCLVQLTAFYLPTLAGASLDRGHLLAMPGTRRRRTLAAAALFSAGFTIPYTLGGALMGGFGQALAGSGLFDPTGPVAVGAGLVMIAMAAVVAYRARAPLVCRLPLPAAVRRSRRLPFLAPFLSGFAIATGCLACFGGAILGVLLVYTGLVGSAWLGALAMFAFSLALTLPFLASALGLSRALPLLARSQRLAPTTGLIAGGLMLFFGVVMATGNYHAVSGWLYQHLPLA
jgi:cytochrome c-type biogenesis protein